jgi:hypothetical protein
MDQTTFDAQVGEICRAYLPSKHPFFVALGSMVPGPTPAQLGRIHLLYQAAMHATRAAVYRLPLLDSPGLRKRKLEILVDDDGLPGGDTHHYQLTRAFVDMGASILLDDEGFGGIRPLASFVANVAQGTRTARFMLQVEEAYARSLGPWVIVEAMSVDWMQALAEALAWHHPAVTQEPYFRECFDGQVEEHHARVAAEVTWAVVGGNQALTAATLNEATSIARALVGVWDDLLQVVLG